MEGSELQQRLQIAKDSFPVGSKVCNSRIGTIGIVCDTPCFEPGIDTVFIPVSYGGNPAFEDTRTLIKLF